MVLGRGCPFFHPRGQSDLDPTVDEAKAIHPPPT